MSDDSARIEISGDRSFADAWSWFESMMAPLREVIDEANGAIDQGGDAAVFTGIAGNLEDLREMLSKLDTFAREDLPELARRTERLIAEIRRLA